MTKPYYIRNDEPSPSETAFLELETLLSKKLPDEYKTFLLNHNGCTLSPNTPKIEADTEWELWGVERFLSVGDLILQQKTTLIYDDKEYIKEYCQY